MTERWAKPIRATTEEYAADLAPAGERPLLHVLEDEADVERLNQGLACPHCLSVFPARPSLATLHQFRALPWGPDWMRDAALKRVAIGRCPTCGGDLSPEMRALTDWGQSTPTRDYGEGNQ